MTEKQTPLLEAPVEAAPGAVSAAAAAAPLAPVKKKKRKGRKGKIIRNVIILVVVLALLAVGGYFLWKFVFYQEDNSVVLEDTAILGSIQSTVQGSGSAKAKNSASLSPNAGGKVLDVYVHEGDAVTQGQELYRIDDKTAQDAVASAQKDVESANKEIQALLDKKADLAVTAPFSGKLMDVADLSVGDQGESGAKIATLVNDTKLRLHLYYNYAYQGGISVGQSAQISIPSVMGAFSGAVEKINMVSRIVPEGGKCFEVILVMDNPGTLTAGMDASASLAAADGASIYPYEDGKLEYYDTKELKLEAGGPVQQVNLMNYADVKAGALLLQMGSKDIDEEMVTKESALKTAQDKLKTATEELDKYHAVAPIDGRVLSCTLIAGEEVASGQGVTIADTSVMLVDIQLDQRNVSYVQPGMMISLTDWNDNMYTGTVQSVSLEAKNENNVTYFPAVVTVDNPDGNIISGQGMRYDFVASQSDGCITVHMASVYTIDEEGEAIMVCFVKAEQKPEDAVDLTPEMAERFKVPEGYYPVPVEVGLADSMNVEILSGLNEGDLLFESWTTDQGDSYSQGGMGGGVMIG